MPLASSMARLSGVSDPFGGLHRSSPAGIAAASVLKVPDLRSTCQHPPTSGAKKTGNPCRMETKGNKNDYDYEGPPPQAKDLPSGVFHRDW